MPQRVSVQSAKGPAVEKGLGLLIPATVDLKQSESAMGSITEAVTWKSQLLGHIIYREPSVAVKSWSIAK